MFSTIVVGTDGSETATAAVALAMDLAQQVGGTVHLVHAVKASPSGVPVAQVGQTVVVRGDSTMSREVQASADALLETAAMAAEDVTVKTHSVSGGAADALIEVAEQVGADLLVVGSKGMRGAHRLIGSIPNSIAHRAPCHVLIAKTA
jgi:nucleotide-binding universal stress UspA family protein